MVRWSWTTATSCSTIDLALIAKELSLPSNNHYHPFMKVGKAWSNWWFVGLVSAGLGMVAVLLYALAIRSDVLTDPHLLRSNVLNAALCFFYAASVASLFLTVTPWHEVNLGFRPDLMTLVKAGYEVRERKGFIDIRVGKYSVARVRESDGRTLIRALPMANGTWALMLFILIPGLNLLILPFALSIYRQCWKGIDALRSRMKSMPVQLEEGADEMIVSGLAWAYRLVGDVVGAHRSKYQDQVLVISAVSLLSWAALLAVNAATLYDGDGFALRMSLGTAVIVTLALGGILMAKKRRDTDLARDEHWGRRLWTAVSGNPENGSPLELLLKACLETPRWLEARDHGLWDREPGKTFLIFILLQVGFTAIASYGSIWWGFYAIGGAAWSLAGALILTHYARARKETEELREQWEVRMKELGPLMGLEWGR
jgi:hypothetical protein